MLFFFYALLAFFAVKHLPVHLRLKVLVARQAARIFTSSPIALFRVLRVFRG
jgi:hypothetical protein